MADRTPPTWALTAARLVAHALGLTDGRLGTYSDSGRFADLDVWHNGACVAKVAYGPAGVSVYVGGEVYDGATVEEAVESIACGVAA